MFELQGLTEGHRDAVLAFELEQLGAVGQKHDARGTARCRGQVPRPQDRLVLGARLGVRRAEQLLVIARDP